MFSLNYWCQEGRKSSSLSPAGLRVSRYPNHHQPRHSELEPGLKWLPTTSSCALHLLELPGAEVWSRAVCFAFLIAYALLPHFPLPHFPLPTLHFPLPTHQSCPLLLQDRPVTSTRHFLLFPSPTCTELAIRQTPAKYYQDPAGGSRSGTNPAWDFAVPSFVNFFSRSLRLNVCFFFSLRHGTDAHKSLRSHRTGRLEQLVPANRTCKHTPATNI